MAKQTEIRSFTLIGEKREGGYTYIYSKELPGFTFMLEPEEEDIKSIISVIEPALIAYLTALFQHENKQRAESLRTAFSFADTRHGRPLNLYGELSFA